MQAQPSQAPTQLTASTQPQPASQPSQPSSQPPAQPAPPQRSITSKSFRFILGKMQSYLQSFNMKALDNLVRVESGGDLIKNLAQCLLYFKVPSHGEQTSRKKLFDQQNPPKWGGKDVLTPRLANELVLKLSDRINLDEMLTFDLLESYFITNETIRKNLIYLLAMDQNITNAESQIPQQQAMPNLQLLQQRLKYIETYKREFNSVVSQSINEAQIIYFQERTGLLTCVLSLLSTPPTKDRAASQYVKELIKANLEGNLLQSLQKNLIMTEVFNGFSCSMREVTASLQREEILILSCLLKLYKYYEVPKAAHITEYIKYQIQTRFKGLRLKPQDYQSDRFLALQQKKITNLAVQQIFNYFQIHELSAGPDPSKSEKLKSFLTALFSNAKDYKDLSLLFEEISILDDINITIYLTFRQFLEVVKKLDLLRSFGLADKAALLQFDFDKNTREIRTSNFMALIHEMRTTDDLFDAEQALVVGPSTATREDLHILLQDFINLVYPFLKANRMEDGMKIAQNITFQIISSPNHLQQIWDQIERNSGPEPLICLKSSAQRAEPKVIYHTLDIFEGILEQPFTFDNFHRFISLMTVLCGNKKHSEALKVMDLLQNHKMSAILPDEPRCKNWTVFQFMIIRFIEMTEELEGGKNPDQIQEDYRLLVTLFGKMIQQNYLIYQELNAETIQLIIELENQMDLEYQDDLMSRRSGGDGRSQRNFLLANKTDPFLSLMLRAFYTITQTMETFQIVKAVKSIINAFTSIYKNIALQSTFLHWISECVSTQGTPIFIEFFQFNLIQYELTENLYTVTRAYVKLVNTIFSQEAPHRFLSYDQQINLGESVLQKFLFNVYQILLVNFTRLQFSDMKDFLKLYYQVLKLTDTLLSKFKDIIPQIKAPLCHQYPQYYETLRMITECMNSDNLEFLIINSLMLGEEVIKGQSSGITNKFWLQQIKQNGSFEDSSQRVRVQKMIQQALKCLNSLADMSYLQVQSENLSNEQKANVNARVFYVKNLKCVTNITNLIKYPGQWETYQIQGTHPVSYSLFNIIQYYVKPHLHLCPFMSQIQIQAILFFFNCCKIWETQPLGERVSLESILRTTGVTNADIRQKYITNFKFAAKSLGQSLSLQYLSAFLDLLTVACSTQSSFVSELFREQDLSQPFIESLLRQSVINVVLQADRKNENNPALKQLAVDLQSKVIILLSEMANNRLNEGFFRKLADGDEYARLFDLIVKQMIEEANKLPTIEFSGELPLNRIERETVDQGNNLRSLGVFSTCQALITLRYFMRLLGDEYQRDLKNLNIKKAIRLLYENQRLIQAIQGNVQGTQALRQMQLINLELQKYQRNTKDQLRDLQQVIETRPNKLMQEQVDLMSNIDCKIQSGESAAVFYSGLEGSQLASFLKKQVHPYATLQIRSLNFGQFGKLGSQFMLNTDEFSDAAYTFFYDDEVLLSEVRAIASIYNLTLSYLYAYQQFIIGHRDFILSIGRTRMRDNMRHRELVLENKAFSTSLLNLVASDEINEIAQNVAVMSGSQNKLARIFIDIARPIARKLAALDAAKISIPTSSTALKAQQEDYSNIAFDLALNEIELDFLGISLGSLNSLGEIGDYQVETLKLIGVDIIGNLVRGLPRIRQNQLMSSSRTAETSQVLKIENDRNAAKIFISLVLQVFSLSIQVQSKDPNALNVIVQNQPSSIELDCIHILSQVLKIMQDTSVFTTAAPQQTQSLFIEGLKILEQSFNLISGDNINYFMRKQDLSPVKIIITKFLSTTSTVEEKIKIIDFFTSYARTDLGSEHLHQENILKNLGITSLVGLVNQIDFYTGDGEAKRNSVHILWCHILLFIRTLNHVLLPEMPEYRRSIPIQISYFSTRIGPLLEFGSHLKEGKFDTKQISLALYEELELMTGIVQQYFDFTDEFFQLDFEHFAEIKDKLLFGVMQLFPLDNQALPNSTTESYLQKMTHDKMASGVLRMGKYTGLDMAIDVIKVKIFFNVNSSLINLAMINANRTGKDDMLNTWDQATSRERNERESRRGSRSNASYYNSQYQNPATYFDDFRSLALLASAVANINLALTSMTDNFKIWLGSEQNLSQLQTSVTKIFLNDVWINNEYLGLNNYYSGSSFVEVLEQYEESLQMGYLVSAMLLSKLKESFDTAEQSGYIASQYSRFTSDDQVTMKTLLDFGDQIVSRYHEFDKELKRSNVVKPSVDEAYGKKIADFIDGIRHGFGLGGGGSYSRQSMFM